MTDELKSILQRAWSLYTGHFAALYSVAIIIWVPCIFFDAWYVAARPFGHQGTEFPFNRPASNFLAVIAVGAMFHYLRETTAGRAEKLPASILAAIKSWGFLFVTQIVVVFCVAIGFLLLIVPGVYLLVRLALVQSVIMAEEAGGLDAFRRSFELTKGKFWTVLLCLVAGGVPALLLSLALTFPLALLFLPYPDWIAQGILATVATLPMVFFFPLLWALYAHLEREEIR